ncbi:MAG: NUDIX domain-containing protein [Candidatus Izemoplasmataceae bacterium]
MKEFKQLRQVIYEGDFASIYKDDIRLENGSLSKRLIVNHIGASSVLALTKTKEVILVKQFRYAINDYTLEIPAGKKDFKEEDGLVCARRELEEETAYVSENFTYMTTFYSAIGYSDEAIDLYLAKDCTLKENPLTGDLDEFTEVIIMPYQEALKAVYDGTIKDSKTVIALLMGQKFLD